MKTDYSKRKIESVIRNGLFPKYHIQKIVKVPNPDFAPTARPSQNPTYNNYDSHIDGLIPVDKDAEYFVLRLDVSDGNDLEHIKACRIGINAYAEAIKHHLPELSEGLKELYPLI